MHRGLPERVFHLRQPRGLEVDFLVEEGDHLIAAEVKSSATVARDFFSALTSLREDLEQRGSHLRLDARIIYGGDQAQQRSNATVIPWHRIQEHRW